MCELWVGSGRSQSQPAWPSHGEQPRQRSPMGSWPTRPFCGSLDFYDNSVTGCLPWKWSTHRSWWTFLTTPIFSGTIGSYWYPSLVQDGFVQRRLRQCSSLIFQLIECVDPFVAFMVNEGFPVLGFLGSQHCRLDALVAMRIVKSDSFVGRRPLFLCVHRDRQLLYYMDLWWSIGSANIPAINNSI